MEEEATNEGQSEREERLGGTGWNPFPNTKECLKSRHVLPEQRTGFILILFL